jgi:transposase InsO family protein
VGHGRRQILWLEVTTNPTAEWIANQITEACGWEQAPCYLIRNRDGAYGEIFVRRVRSIGIRDRPTSPRSPWQNAYAQRLIGSIRRECTDHIVIFGVCHLGHVLLLYMGYYNGMRTHLSLNKDAPTSRGVEWAGNIVCRPILGGLHHQYGRI